MVHTSDLIDIASHHSTPATISVNVGMSLNRQVDLVVVNQPIKTINHDGGFLRIYLHPQSGHQVLPPSPASPELPHSEPA